MPEAPTWLKWPKWSKVDLVDRPADGHAEIAIWKRDEEVEDDYLTPEGTIVMKSQDGDDEEPAEEAPEGDSEEDEEDEEDVEKREFSTDQREALAKQGKALPDGSFPIVNTEDLKNAVQAFGRASDKGRAKAHIIKRAKALGATELLPENWKVSKKEEGAMPEPLSEEILKSLPDEALEYIGDLERKLDEGNIEPSNQDVTKRDDLPVEVREEIEKRDAELATITKRLEQAEAVAKAERDARITREWEDRVSRLDHLTLPDEVVKQFKTLADTQPEFADEIYKSLVAANEQTESAAIFSEIGKSAPAEGSAEAEATKIAKAYQAETPGLTFEQAYDKALAENPTLFARAMTEEA